MKMPKAHSNQNTMKNTKSKKIGFSKNLTVQNRKAAYEYHLERRYTAGILLNGAEVKSIRMGKVNLQGAYCLFVKGELWIRGLHISPYVMDLAQKTEPERERKLLLNKHELQKIAKKIDQKNYTLVPTKLFISTKGWIKIEIAIAKGKKLYDKRQTLKDKEMKRKLSQYK